MRTGVLWRAPLLVMLAAGCASTEGVVERVRALAADFDARSGPSYPAGAAAPPIWEVGQYAVVLARTPKREPALYRVAVERTGPAPELTIQRLADGRSLRARLRLHASSGALAVLDDVTLTWPGRPAATSSAAAALAAQPWLEDWLPKPAEPTGAPELVRTPAGSFEGAQPAVVGRWRALLHSAAAPLGWVERTDPSTGERQVLVELGEDGRGELL